MKINFKHQKKVGMSLNETEFSFSIDNNNCSKKKPLKVHRGSNISLKKSE